VICLDINGLLSISYAVGSLLSFLSINSQSRSRSKDFNSASHFSSIYFYSFEVFSPVSKRIPYKTDMKYLNVFGENQPETFPKCKKIPNFGVFKVKYSLNVI